MTNKDNLYGLDGRLPLAKAVPFGLQHVLAMFVSNATPIIILAYTSYIYSLSHSSVKYYDEGTFESGEYFNSYPLTDLMENKTLSPAEILNCMTSKVRSIDDLKSALISKYSSKKDDISSCFSPYGL